MSANQLPSRPPLADLNGQSQVSAATDAKLQGLLMNPRITGPIHLGTELAKMLFTKEEMAASTLTGRIVNGQCKQLLDSGRLCIIDHLVQQKFSIGEAEFASGIRDSLANRCKYLRLKLAPIRTSVSSNYAHTDFSFCYHSLITIAVTLFYYSCYCSCYAWLIVQCLHQSMIKGACKFRQMVMSWLSNRNVYIKGFTIASFPLFPALSR